MASAPKADTMRVITIDITQYAIPCIAVGIPILQIPFRYSAGIFANRVIPFNTFSFFCFTIPRIMILITINCAVTVAMAPPAAPSFGSGPGPRIRSGSRIIFVARPIRFA